MIIGIFLSIAVIAGGLTMIYLYHLIFKNFEKTRLKTKALENIKSISYRTFYGLLITLIIGSLVSTSTDWVKNDLVNIYLIPLWMFFIYLSFFVYKKIKKHESNFIN